MSGRQNYISYIGDWNTSKWFQVSSFIDSQGKGFYFNYDYNRGTKEHYAQIKNRSGLVKEVWYDSDGKTKRVNINGRPVLKIETDKRNVIIDGKATEVDGRNLFLTDEKGNITKEFYDEWDNLTRVIYPEESKVSYEYEHKYNKRIKETDENGVVTQYGYDDAGNMTRKIEAAGTFFEKITEYTYDADGNRLTEKVLGDENTPAALTAMAYDSWGNMTSVTDPEGNTTHFTHDTMGNVLTKEDARGKVWTYEYDAKGQMTSVKDPLSNTTRFYYDGIGNKIRDVDADRREKTCEYDIRDKLIKTVDFD